ncbi:unnamed protein product [Callosobruchus maculatus]|uniref:Uncharacterized protein n=1 Tax=Callosobruchus maculatus TaxID=64391 RepID=A0A653CH71_CALMS|nr:unnamed protein product [Callosobruchus maculatus]
MRNRHRQRWTFSRRKRPRTAPSTTPAPSTPPPAYARLLPPSRAVE